MIRPAETRDLNAIITLAKEMHQEGAYKDIPFHIDQFIATVSRCMRDGFAWVGEKDGKVVSAFLAGISEYNFSRSKMACDHGAFTTKEYRKTRLAFQLLKKYIEWAQSQEVEEIMIGASTGFEGTYAERLGNFLQKRLGFRQAGHWYKLRI